MSKVDDGGNAFPGKSGMSLRDYFAAQAMQAIVSNPKELASSANGCGETQAEFSARVSYNIADAMLIKRSE